MEFVYHFVTIRVNETSHTYGGFVPAISEWGMTTVDRRQRARWRLVGAWVLELAGDGGEERVGRGSAREVLTGDGGVAERQRIGGNERQRLELITRAKGGDEVR
jgi:hypothetical protein